MIKLLQRFSLLAFSLAISSKILACSCDDIPMTFCYKIHSSDHVAKVKIVSFYQHYMDVQVIENLQLNTGADTITIIGQDGFNCNEWLDRFNVGDTLIVNLYNRLNGKFDLDGCGVSYLIALGDHVFSKYSTSIDGNRQIKPGVSAMSYEAFKNDFADCIVMSSSSALSSLNKMNIYPNPAIGTLSISPLDKDQKYTAAIYSACNQLISISTHEDGQNEINIDKLLPGVYFLKLELDGNVEIRKFIKI